MSRYPSSSSKKSRTLSSKGYTVSTPRHLQKDNDFKNLEVSAIDSAIAKPRNFSSHSSTLPDDDLGVDNSALIEGGDSTCFVDEGEAPTTESLSDLYDEYLLAHLSAVKAKEERTAVESHVKSEISNMLSTVQGLVYQNNIARDKDSKIRSEEAKIHIYKDILSFDISELEATCSLIHELALALDSRHSHLKVEGAPLYKDDGYKGDPKALVKEVLSLLSSLAESGRDYPNMKSLAGDLDNLRIHLSEIYETWGEFKIKSGLASDLLTRLESLKFSLEEKAMTEENYSLLKPSVPLPLTDIDNKKKI